MKKEILALLLLLTSCGRGDEFYKKRCVYNNYKDERGKFCDSDYKLSKVDKSQENAEKSQTQLNLKPTEATPTKPAEPKPVAQPAIPEVKKVDERVKSEEEIKYEKWIKQIEEAVGTLEEKKEKN
jgi:hypothetical protein